MLAQGVMDRDLVTFKPDTSVIKAQKIMSRHHYRRIPVVDNAGRPIGLITQRRLFQVMPKAGTPLVWQMRYLLARTKVSDVMRKELVTAKPTDTLEKVAARAQQARVGTTLVVDDDGKLVGVVSTNDIFYRVVNPTLGVGEEGTRIVIGCAGDSRTAARVLGALADLGVETNLIWSSPSSTSDCIDLTLQIDAAHEKTVCDALTEMKLEYQVR
jgi:acetoin utilization protein AcuB